MAKTKRYNVSQYANNLARSAKQIAGSVLRSSMPTLSDTIISTQDIVSDLRKSANETRMRLEQHKRMQDNTILRGTKVLLNNIKDDLKSGKLYNEDRMFGGQDSMSQMLMEYGSDENNSELEKVAKSSLGGSVFNSKEITSSAFKNTEYLAELEKSHHNQKLFMDAKSHKENINALTNIQTIGMSILEFNNTVLRDHIAKTQAYHAQSLQKMDEIKILLEEQNKRYTSKNKGSTIHPLENILNSRGGLNIKEYAKYVKGNVSRGNPFGMVNSSMFKMMGASPISSILEFALPYMLPKDVMKKLGNYDKQFTGSIAQFFGKMDDWKHGDNKLLRSLGNIFGVNFERGTKPNLAKYKTDSMTLEIEQKKAKAITEVIPTYLSEIVNVMTGKNMIYNYNTGRFMDRAQARKNKDNELRTTISTHMTDTRGILNESLSARTINKSSRQKETYAEDLDRFIYWLSINPNVKVNQLSYQDARSNGLDPLRGGNDSFEILKESYRSVSREKMNIINRDRLLSNKKLSDTMRNFSNDLNDSGLSALYATDGITSTGGRQFNYSNTSQSSQRRVVRMSRPSTVTNEHVSTSTTSNTNDNSSFLDRFDYSQYKDKLTNIYQKTSPWLKRSVLGTGAGVLVSKLMRKNPIVGAVIGGAANIMLTSEKVSNFLWGDPNNENDKGLLGEFRDTIFKPIKDLINKHLLNPFKKFIGNKLDSLKGYMKREFGFSFGSDDSDSEESTSLSIAQESETNQLPQSTQIAGYLPAARRSFKAVNKNSFNAALMNIRNGVKPKPINEVNSYTTSVPAINTNLGSIADNIINSIIDYRPYFEDITRKLTIINSTISASNPFNDSGSTNEIEETVLKNPIGSKINFGKMKVKLGGVKDKVDKIDFNKIGDNIKNGLGFIGGKAKKGLSLAKSAAMSTLMGLGPLPGAIFGAMFGRKNKNRDQQEEKENNEIIDNIEETQEKLGLGDKFKNFLGNRKRNAIGMAASSLLGMGPLPGLLVSSMINRKKKNNSNEDKENEEVADSIEETQEKMGIGSKFKNFLGNRKRNVIGMAASSLLGMGPLPGLLVSSMINRKKKKNLKNNEDKENEEVADSIEESQNKLGVGSKFKNFLGNRKRNAIGMAASSLLGMGPLPGLLVSSMINRKKKKDLKKAIDDAHSQKLGQIDDPDTDPVSKGRKIGKSKNPFKSFKNKFSRLFALSSENKTAQADDIEKEMVNKINTSEDLEAVESMTQVVANTKNAQAASMAAVTGDGDKPGILDNIMGMLSGGGMLGSLVGIVGSVLAALGLGNLIGWLKDKKSTGTLNEQGDYNFQNTADYAYNGAVAAGNKFMTKRIFGKTAGNSAFLATQAASTSRYYGDMAKAYSDRGDSTNALEMRSASATNAAKAVRFGASTIGKISEKVAAKATSGGSGWLTKICTFFNNKILKNSKVVNWCKKIKLSPEKLGSIFKKIATEGAEKAAKKAPNIIAKIVSKVGQIASVALAWLPVATAISAFVNGLNNASRDLGTSPSDKMYTRVRIANGFLYAIDDVLCGLLDITGLRDKALSLITNMICTKEQLAEISKSQEKQQSAYEAFLKENDLSREAYTFDMYNKHTNKSLLGHIKSAFGMNDLNKYKAGGKENAKLREKYGGYTPPSTTFANVDNSVTNTVLVGGTPTGSGFRLTASGRSSLGAAQSAKVLQNVANNLKLKSVGGNIVGDTQQKSNNESKVIKNEKINNKIGKSIQNMFSWAGSKLVDGFNYVKNGISGAVSAGWDWIKTGAKNAWNSFWNIFDGNGGRGPTDPDYYNQMDPRWSNQSFGKYGGRRDTVGDGGCGPTVAAMALQKLTGSKIYPSTMAKYALQSGYKVDDGGTTPDFFNDVGSNYGYNFETQPGINKETIINLKLGKPVPLLGQSGPYGPGSHYLLANDIDSKGNVTILDPQNPNNNGKHHLSSLINTTTASMIPSNNYCRSYGRSCNNKYVRRAISRTGRSRYWKRVFGRGTSTIVDRLISINFKESNRGKNDIKYIVIHYTASENGSAEGAITTFNTPGKEVSAHYCVDSAGIYRTVKDKDIAWHCGGPRQGDHGGTLLNICTNNNSIGIEIASHKDTNKGYYIDDTAAQNAANLTRSLMNQYGIPIDNVVRHFDVTGKSCPAPWVTQTEHKATPGSDEGWRNFKSMVSGSSGSFNGLTNMQQKIVNEARSRLGETKFRSGDNYAGQDISGKCMALITNIYKSAGQSCTLYNDAKDAKSRDSTYVSGKSNIPIGATVLFPCKTQHGHTAVYVGNDKIIHAYPNSTGVWTVTETTIQQIIDDGYTEVGWSWMGGTAAGTSTDGTAISGEYKGNMLQKTLSALSSVAGEKGSLLSNALAVALGESDQSAQSNGSLPAGTTATVNEIYSELKGQGFSHNGSVAILANMKGESGFNTGAVGDNGTSYGLCQWHNDRKDSLLNYNSGYDPSSVKHQVSYLKKEMEDYGLFDEFSGDGNINDLVKQMVYDFEKPGDMVGETTKRQGYVSAIEAAISGSGGRGINNSKLKALRDSILKDSIYDNSNMGVKPMLSNRSIATLGRGGADIVTPVSQIQATSIAKQVNNARGAITSSSSTETDLAILTILKEISNTLNSIASTNNVIANKEYSVNLNQTSKGNNTYAAQGQSTIDNFANRGMNNKKALVDSIVSGI